MKDTIVDSSTYIAYLRQLANAKMYISDGEKTITNRNSIVSESVNPCILSRSIHLQFNRNQLKTAGPLYSESGSEPPLVDPVVPELVIPQPLAETSFFSDIIVGNDGAPTQPYFDSPEFITIDTYNNLLFVDRAKHVVRRIDAITGAITTVAGSGTNDFTGPFTGDGGSATSARLQYPTGLAVDADGNLFIADTNNHRIRKVDAATSIITTYAGSGTEGFSGDGVLSGAKSANLNFPTALAVDSSGNLFIADTLNSRIRKVDLNGTITTVAGNGTAGFTGEGVTATSTALNYPSGVVVDSSGNIFISDTDNNRVRRVDFATKIITRWAGTGGRDSTGDGGLATAARMISPRGLALDSSGNLFIADSGNNQIRRVDFSTRIITTVAGYITAAFSGDNGAATDARLANPHGVVVDSSGNIFISDTNNNRIRRVDFASKIINTVGGNGYLPNSSSTYIKLNGPTGITVAGDKIYVVDTDIHNIYVVNRISGLLEAVYGSGVPGLIQTSGFLRFNKPNRVGVDSAGNIYVSDSVNNRIRRINFPLGDATTIAGGGVDTDTSSGTANTKLLNRPSGVAVFGSIIYFSNSNANNVCKIENGNISNLPGTYSSPQGLAVDSAGNLYVANAGLNKITKVTAAGTFSDIILSSGTTLDSPRGVAVVSDGSIYVVDDSNRLLKIITGGEVTVVEDSLIGPMDVSVDVDKNIYVVSFGGKRVVKLIPTSMNSFENSVLYIPSIPDTRLLSDIITFPVNIASAEYVTSTPSSIIYSIPEPFNVESYSVVTVDIVSSIAINSINSSIYSSGSIVYIRINNLNALTSYRTTLTCVDVNNRIVSIVLADATTTTHDQTLNRLSNMLYTNTTPVSSLSPQTLVTTVGYDDTLPTPSKTDFLYNYNNHDVVTYPLIRLFGKWPFKTSGNLIVSVNGYFDGISWAFYNNEFKVYAKLFSSGRAVYGRTSGLNVIVISDGTTEKTVRIYYDRPTIVDSTPKVRPYLFDGYNGPGTCDAPPSRTDNTLEDNRNRMKLDMLLLQSFFAESFKCAREAQEGIFGLPYSTFVIDLDSNDEPIVDFITDLSRTREQYVENNYNTNNGLLTFLSESVNARYGASSTINGGNLYSIGFAMISHLDPVTGVYTGAISDASVGVGIINSANLIWHPKSLSEMQAAWNDQSPLPTIYNQFDIANKVGDSCGRIIGSLLHELTHIIPKNDHPSQIIGLTQAYPSSYLFPFDAENYRTGFGIDENDATGFRNWVMAYNYNRTSISHVYSELGPSSKGWWSPYVIHGYINVNESVQTNYTVNRFKLLSTSGSGTVTLESATTALNDNDPIVVCYNPSEAMPDFSGESTGRVFYIHSVISSTQIRLKKSAADISFLTSLPTLSGNVYIIKYNDTLYFSANRIGWINSNVLLPHPKKTNLSTFRTNTNLNIPNDFREGYLDVYAWGAGGRRPLNNTTSAGAGGFVKTLIPIKNTDSISLKIGVTGGGGVSNPRSGGPYGGAGGGSTIIFINNSPYVIVGGGGGAGYNYPGRTVYQTTTYSIADGFDGVNLSGSGGDNLQYDNKNLAGCGGAGHYGGLSGKNVNSVESGGGYGTSYVRSSNSLAVLRGGIASVVNAGAYQTALSSKHIVPSVFDAMPTSVGSSEQNGCVALKFIYTKSVGFSNPIIPAYTIPSTSTTDSASVTTLIPRPLIYSLDANTFTFNSASPKIYCNDSDILPHAEVLQSEIFNLTGILPNILQGEPENGSIVLVKYAAYADTDNKYYKFSVTINNNFAMVYGYDITGISHGTSTLLQLMRVNGSTATIQSSYIEDYSTCQITGIHIDMARDSYEIHNMKYLIDMCRFYKMRYIHIHGNDEGFNNNPTVNNVKLTSPALWDSGMVFYWNPVGNVVSGDPTTLGGDDTAWYRSKSNWDMLVEYARIRGVAFIPEIEMYGRGAGLRGRFPLTFGSGFPIMNLVNDACHDAIKSIIQQLSETFYTSPFIFFGCDESDDSEVANISGAAAFCSSKQINYNRDTIINYYFYQMYSKINSLGKRMIVWNDYSTKDRNTDFTGTNGVSYKTNNEIISCVWMINGGAAGADGYVNGGGEDTTPYNLHSGSSVLMNSNIPVLQTPWKPRIYSKMKAMFDWSVGGGLNTSILPLSTPEIQVSNPLPITPNLMGSETLLWEAAKYHDVKSLMLRYKAPMRVENTYSFGKNSTSWYSTFSSAFEYLDNRFTTLISGVRLIESGITQSLSYKMRTDNDVVQIPFTSFGDGLRLTLMKINPNLTIYYTLSSNLSIYPYTNQDTRVVDLAKASLYTSPIEITKYDTRLLNGFICFRAQCYDASNNPVGPVIDRRYVCELFKLNLSGGLLPTLNEGRYGDSSTAFNACFNTLLTLTISDIAPSGYVNFRINNDQIPLTDNIQINIYSTTNPISISYFDSNGVSCGKSYTVVPVLLSNPRGDVTGSYKFPYNVFKMIPIVTLNLTFSYTNSVTVALKQLLSSIVNYPGGVMVTCIVVGRGGSGASKSAISSEGGGGGGGGGISREVYYNVPIDYSLYIQIGTQSSVSFTQTCLRNLKDDVGLNKLQDPIYPTIAYGGTNANLTTAGTRGTITKGDLISAANATDGSYQAYGIGGQGYVYNGVEYGRGGNGGITGASGTPGLVLINLRNM